MAKTIYWCEHRSKKKTKKKEFQKEFSKLMSNVVFGKTVENVWKHRHIKLFTTERKMTYLVLEQYYHTTIFFTENLLAIETNKKQI